MRKNYFITVLLSATLLISGCSNVTVPQTVSEDETKETLKTMQEQINTMQGSLENYITSPAETKYELISAEDLNPVYTESSSSIILQISSNDDQYYKEISPLFVFYDLEGNILSYSTAYFSNIYPGTVYATNVLYQTTNEDFPYDHYEVQYRGIKATEKDIDKDLKEQINVTSNISPNGSVIAKFTNQSDQTIDYISSYVLFYQGEQLIGCTESGAYDLIPGSFGIAEYGSPFDSYYNNIPFDDYELVITSASQYNNPPQPELYR